MAILDKIFGPHSRNLERALSRTTERHSLLTSNLANVNTPGFKRRDVEFGVMVEGEQNRPGDRLRALQQRTGVQRDNGSVRIDGNSVDLEQEVMSMAQAELRYQALSEMTSRHFSGLQSVIREGR